MHRKIMQILIIILMMTGQAWTGQPADAHQNWHQWRGPAADGVALHGNPPILWSETDHIRWKIPLPGSGLASPIVWDDQIFILTAVETDRKADPSRRNDRPDMPMWMRTQASTTDYLHEFTILSIDKSDGHTQWRKVLREDLPFAGTHKDGTWASNSPVTDGDHVYAYFGSYGLYCLDMAGNLIWEKDLGYMETRNSFGEGSSPALYGDKLIINWDHEGQSFIIVMDKRTGEILWKKDRDEVTSWSTPLVVDSDGKPQIIVSATGAVRGYDLDTGDTLWETTGMTTNVIPSPVYADGRVFVMSGFRGAALQAIDLEKAGSVTNPIVWSHDANTPYTPSSLLYDDCLYFLKGNKEQLSCFEAATGKAHYEAEKLEGMRGVYASPVVADGRVYVVGRNGVTHVIQSGRELKVLAVNTLDDGFDASPAIVGNAIILRGLENLYCIQKND